ncbi:MAG: hypothetical protein LBS18_05075 [Clostridiales bacterium]|nr:hypothetical protein [Clostridiales bacterium]
MADIEYFAIARAPFLIYMMFFVNWGRVVDGADDNLTDCLVFMLMAAEASRETGELRALHETGTAKINK